MKTKIMILVVILILGLTIPVNACISTRAASMGYAGVSCANDSTVIYWNQALLPEIPNGVQYQHDVTPQIDSFNGAYLVPRSAMSFSLTYNGIGFCYVENWGREYWMLGTGFKLTDKLSIGGCLDIDSKYGRDFILSADYSINYHINDDWNFALLCQSFYNYRPSVTYTTDITTICFEWYDCFNLVSCQHIRLGVEQKIDDLVLRCGLNNYAGYLKNTNSKTTLYFGIGYKFDIIEISVGTIQDNSYSMGIIYNF